MTEKVHNFVCLSKTFITEWPHGWRVWAWRVGCARLGENVMRTSQIFTT